MNWTQITGKNKISVDKNQLKYISDRTAFSEIPPDITLQNLTDKQAELLISEVKCSEYFENGTIEFDFLIKSPDAVITLKIDDYVMVGLNSRYSSYMYTIRRFSQDFKEIKIVSGAGVKGIGLDLNQKHNFKVQVFGSTILFFINQVEVCRTSTITSTYKSQISLSFVDFNEVQVSNISIKTEKPKVFVVMQFSEEYENLYQDVIKPVSEKFGYECIKGDEFFAPGSVILEDITNSIKESSVIIADITPDNPNVFYEVGYAHALNKPTILLSDKKRPKLPFDVSGFRTLFYDNTIGGKTVVESRLIKHFENIQQK